MLLVVVFPLVFLRENFQGDEFLIVNIVTPCEFIVTHRYKSITSVNVHRQQGNVCIVENTIDFLLNYSRNPFEILRLIPT